MAHLHYLRKQPGRNALGPLVAQIARIKPSLGKAHLGAADNLWDEPGLKAAAQAEFDAGGLRANDTLWMVQRGPGEWASLPEAPAPDDLIDDMGLMFRDDPEVLRHRLFEGAEGVSAPPDFRSGYVYGVYYDEAVRRAGGREAFDALPVRAEVRAKAQRIIESREWQDRDGTQPQPPAAAPEPPPAPEVAAEAEPALPDAEEAERPEPPPRPAGQIHPPLTEAQGRRGMHPRLREILALPGAPAIAGESLSAVGEIPPLGGDDFAPPEIMAERTGDRYRADANVAAIEALQADGPMTPERQAAMAEYVGWGGLPGVFDESKGEWAGIRDRLKELLTESEYEAARTSTLNAHYTSLPVIRAMHEALAAAGVPGDGSVRALEPSAGTGHFVGAAPQGWQFDAVELDGITARIASALYPKRAQVRNKGFERHNLARDGGDYDVVMTNPPFGSYKVHDPESTGLSNAYTIHNFFLLKSLKALRPGGFGAFVISKFFMDSLRSDHRKLAHQMGELVGAVRLPNSAFTQNAGTEVVSDVLVFRRRALDEVVTDTPEWIHADRHISPDNADVHDFINRMMHNESAERVIGEPSWDAKMYGKKGGYTVNAPVFLDDQAALGAELAGRLVPMCLGSEYRPASDAALPGAEEGDDLPLASEVDAPEYAEALRNGGYVIDRQGQALLMAPKGGAMRAEPVRMRNEVTGRRRLVGLMDIRDAVQALVVAESDLNCGPDVISDLRQHLNERLDEFLTVCGTKQMERDGLAARVVASAFRADPLYPLVAALYAPMGGKEPVRGEILERRVVYPDRDPPTARTLPEGVACSLATFGRLDPPWIAEQLGMGVEECERDLVLSGLAFEDVGTGNLVDAATYLSGDVRHKLDSAREAAEQDARFEVNVGALEAVLPKDVPFEDIFVQMGAPWIPDDLHQRFLNFTLSGVERWEGANTEGLRVVTLPNGDIRIQEPHGYDSQYSPELHRRSRDGKYGNTSMRAEKVAEGVLNGTALAVYEYLDVPDGKGGTRKVQRLLEQETFEVNECANRLREAWEDWVQGLGSEDQAALVSAYNERMNRIVHRSYDAGELPFTGMAHGRVTLRPTQKQGIWRAILDQSTLLDHTVGAGKTFTMAAAAMEMRRMGLAKRPMFVVPNHLVAQWAQEFYTLYPGAKLLVFEPGSGGRKARDAFVAKTAVGDWDGVICPHSTFTAIPMTEEWRIQSMKERIREIDDLILAMQSESESGYGRFSVKQAEKQRKQMEKSIEKMEEKLRSRQPGSLYFDHLGVDALFVDESHAYKNLGFTSKRGRSISGLGNPEGSQRALDMLDKVNWLREREAKVVMATGTPIANSVCEMYHLNRYMDPEAMKRAKIIGLDGWLKSFALVDNDWEVNVTGTKFVNRARVRAFENVTEMSQHYRAYADVVLKDDLEAMAKEAGGRGWPIPGLANGGPENVVLPRGEAAEAAMDSVVGRLEAIESKSSTDEHDNHLVCLSDARKAALDPRLLIGQPRFPELNWTPADAPAKVDEVADSVHRIWREWDARKGTQLVFADLGTPKGILTQERAADYAEALRKARADTGVDAIKAEADVWREMRTELGGWDFYNALKVELAAKGMPPEQVAFAHEATSDAQRKALHERMRQGDVRVLMGSTEKMGTGMNVQHRMVALHEVDAPWRPGDLEQREGRILRPGNEFYRDDPDGFKVRIRRYATECTGDPKMWQSLETKGRFIAQLRSGKLDQGAMIEDTQTLSYAEMKALSAANPLILEELMLAKQVKELDRKRIAHQRALRSSQSIVAHYEKFTSQMDAERDGLLMDIERRDAYQGDSWWSSPEGGERLTVDAFQKEEKDPQKRGVAVRKQVAGEFMRFIRNAVPEWKRDAALKGRGRESPIALGVYRGMAVEIVPSWSMGTLDFDARDNEMGFEARAIGKGFERRISFPKSEGGFSASGLVRRLENIAGNLEGTVQSLGHKREARVREYRDAKEKVAQPFAEADELARLKARLSEVGAELRASASAQKPSAPKQEEARTEDAAAPGP